MTKVKLGVRDKIRLQEVAQGHCALTAFAPKTTERLLDAGLLAKSEDRPGRVYITDLGVAELARLT